jgi:type II secretory pathway pseudopilin PulG
VRTVLQSLRRAHSRVTATGESGATLIELFVAMIIMSIAGSIFVAATVSLFRSTNEAQAVTNSATSTNQAYQALDKMVRYAAAISPPDISTGTGATKDWYVELSDTTSGVEVCTQLRVDITSQQLQQRTWTASNLATLTAWRPIASNITNGAAVLSSVEQPFVLDPATATDLPSTATAQHQKLTITMVSASGPANQRVKSSTSFVLSALNSTIPVRTGTICQQAGRP